MYGQINPQLPVNEMLVGVWWLSPLALYNLVIENILFILNPKNGSK